MRHKDPRELQRVLVAGLQLMELSPEILRPKQRCSFEEATKYLDEVKARIKKAYKRAALRHHPDRPDGDEEKMKLLSSAMEIVESLVVQPRLPPPPPIVQVVHVRHYGGFSNSTTTAGSNSVFRSWTGGSGSGTTWF